MSAPILEIRDLCVSYGKVEALHHINLKVEAGKIVTVIGPNGAGKTTMLSAIMGLLPARGEIEFQGEVQRDIEVEHLVAMGMTLVPEKRELFGEMSVEDNLVMASATRRRPWTRSSPPSRV
jgi:branched-chain amino acid transport system ATP-binding protein